jgi:hypothetical protein
MATWHVPSPICSEISKVCLIHRGLCRLYPRKRTHDENNRDCVGRTLDHEGRCQHHRDNYRLCAKRLTEAWTLDFFAEFFGRPALPRVVNLSSTTLLQQTRIKILLSMLSSIRRFSRRSDQKVNTLECQSAIMCSYNGTRAAPAGRDHHRSVPAGWRGRAPAACRNSDLLIRGHYLYGDESSFPQRRTSADSMASRSKIPAIRSPRRRE